MIQLQQLFARFRRQSSRRRRKRRATCEALEPRALLASVMDSGTTLQISLEANEGLQIVSLGDSYEFTSTTSNVSNDGVTDSSDFSAFDNSSLSLTDLAQYTHIEISDAANGASVEFPDSGTGAFQHHLDIVFDELAAARSVDFSGLADFGDNNLTINSTGAVHMRPGTDLRVHNGNISIVATNQTDGSELRNGIETFGATITTSGIGDIQLTGTGATLDQQLNRLDGIWLRGNTTIQSTSTAAAAGSIQINGTGGGGTAFEIGVLIEDVTISSVIGDISVTGSAGPGTEHSHYGVNVKRSTIESTGTTASGADITFDGTGGTAEDFGIGTIMSENTIIRTIGGNVSIVGRGGAGSGTNNQGFRLKDVLIQSSGTGNNAGQISIAGIGGTGTAASGGGLIQTGTQILSVDGAIIVDADAGPAITEHGNNGLYVAGIIRSSGDAPISLTGSGSAGSSFARGVEIVGAAALVESITAPITITGTAGNATDGNGDGVEIRTGAIVTSAVGDISITGTGGTGETGHSRGVRVLSDAQVRSTGTGANAGSITIDATGGVGTNWNLGFDLNRGRVETIDGEVNITGRGGRGTGGSNRGIHSNGGRILSTGTGADAGNITLTGLGGSGNKLEHRRFSRRDQ